MAHEAIGPGSLIASRFRLEDLLEEHSGAHFWRATDLTLARNVAIHVISAEDPRADAVLTAARTSATVSDPRFLRVLDALDEGGWVSVVHEWGSGLSLDRMLAEDILEPRRAAWLVREVAEAITVAHRHGVAHGRLLPENVLVTDAGSVKLIGFVVDAVLHGRPQPAEGFEEAPSEHEADVRNLGALLYACLTGRWPGVPASQVPAAPVDHDRTCRPRQVRPGVPRQLDTLCDDILALDEDGPGFESAAEVAAALGAYLGDSLSAAHVPVGGPAAFLDPEMLPPPRETGSLGSYDGAPTVGEDATEESSAVSEDTQPGRRAAPVLQREESAEDDPEPVDAPRSPGIGMGAGPPPPYWGPDRPPDSGSEPLPPVDSPGTSWLRLGAVIGLVAVALLAIVIAFNLGGARTIVVPGPGDEDATAQEDAAPEPVSIAEVSDFDPDGGDEPEENADLVPLAVDGDPSTAWETYTYFDGPELAPYRDGVGLLLDLGEETEVRQVRVSLAGGPYDLALLAAPEGSEEPPTDVDGLETLTDRSGVSGRLRWSTDESVTTRYLVVWLTALPRTSGGYRGGVTEVSVRA